MELIDFLNISGEFFVNFFFKAFAILLSILYLLYAVVNTRQTQVMQKTVSSEYGGLIIFITSLQIGLAIILIVLAFALL